MTDRSFFMAYRCGSELATFQKYENMKAFIRSLFMLFSASSLNFGATLLLVQQAPGYREATCCQQRHFAVRGFVEASKHGNCWINPQRLRKRVRAVGRVSKPFKSTGVERNVWYRIGLPAVLQVLLVHLVVYNLFHSISP